MKEPIRLCDGDQLPSALREAFRALEREAPNAEMVARVQQVLQTLPATTPGVAAVSTLSAGKLLVLGTMLAVGVGSIVALRSERAAISQAPASQQAPVVESARFIMAPAPGAVGSERTPSDTAHMSQRQRASAPAISRDSPQPEARASKRAARAEAHAAARTSANVTGRTRSGESTARPAQVPTVAPQEVAVTRADAAAPAASAPNPEAAASQASEARMLAHAKRLAISNAGAALRQVETLAVQFPAGLFVQERELLEIQLHRQLGHAARAEQLAQQFQQRYPRSVYRRALMP